MTPELETTYLLHELEQLQQENAKLSKALGEATYHSRRVQLAYEDALLLAQWRSAGIIPSRRYAKYHKMSQRRWQNAVALLRMARIVVGHRRWSTDEVPLIEKRLEQAKIKAQNDQQLFFLRLNRHGRR